MISLAISSARFIGKPQDLEGGNLLFLFAGQEERATLGGEETDMQSRQVKTFSALWIIFYSIKMPKAAAHIQQICSTQHTNIHIHNSVSQEKFSYVSVISMPKIIFKKER